MLRGVFSQVAEKYADQQSFASACICSSTEQASEKEVDPQLFANASSCDTAEEVTDKRRKGEKTEATKELFLETVTVNEEDRQI